MEIKKVCPLKFKASIRRDCPLDWQCEENDCAWWCEWAECCAMVAIPAEISDRAHDIVQTMRD